MVCTVFAVQIAVAQKVTGDKYSGTFAISRKTVLNSSIRTVIARTTDGSNASRDYPIRNAFDSNEGTWWSSSRSGNVNIDLEFTRSTTLQSFHFFSGGSSNEREASIYVYTSSNGSNWTIVESITGIDTGQRSHDYYLTNSVSSRYWRLQLRPKEANNTLAINEITLYANVETRTTDDCTIQHKQAKWFDLRSQISEAAKAMDTFDDEVPWYAGPQGNIQASHIYMDTIYVHKGTSVALTLPDRLTESSVQSYQRWYSYRTDATYRTLNEGSNEVWDLLTPPSGITPYRFANGYVGKPLTATNVETMNFYFPTDDEFAQWYGTASEKYDNNYYLVACDVSGYTDYTKNFTNNDASPAEFFPTNQADGQTYEPTLTHRVIYYIQAVDGRDSGSGATAAWKVGMGRLKNADYQGARNENLSSKKFLEEYDITFPATRVSNNTLELVALSKNAASYTIPDATNDANVSLTVRLVDNNSGITLQTESVSGTDRIIQFNYPRTNSDQTQSVNADNSTATIYVTKTVGGTIYNIARFNLTFDPTSRLLTQTQLDQIENGTIKDNNLKGFQFRTEKYLENNYEELTRLDFDYDPNVANLYGQSMYYQFPVAWSSSSYSFYDGADGADYQPSSSDHYYPEWGYYAIMNGFVENEYWDAKNAAQLLPNSTYHMYIDASDRAGVIARLPFEQNLCAGSEMFVTAWVKSAGYSGGTPDAGMLFSIMGVTTDVTGQTVYVPIYRHVSSQIRRTDYLSSEIPGAGAGTNEWFQVYFSFILENNADFDSYVLQVDNYSQSTDGGDMYIDDIHVYLARPNATVTQLEATCTNERTMMSVKLDWDRILSRMGIEEAQSQTSNEENALDFCFIDKKKYESYLAEHPADYANAIDYAAVLIGNGESGDDGYDRKYATLYFNSFFEKNNNYDNLPHPRLAIDNRSEDLTKAYFYRTGTGEERGLVVDFYSNLTPNRSYMMLMQIHDDSDQDGLDQNDFAVDINDPCGINTEFFVTAQTLLRVNGEIVDPTTDFCQGQIFNFAAKLRVPTGEYVNGIEQFEVVEDGIYFDWFFGTEEEFIKTQTDSKYEGTSLLMALSTFRDIFPDKEEIDADVVPGDYDTDKDGNIDATLTKGMIQLLKDSTSVTSGDVGGLNAALVLHRPHLNIRLLQSGLKLIVKPIPTLLPPDGTSISEDLWLKVCWNYVPLELNVSGAAPTLHTGFNALHYPSPDFDPCLRIGLKQIEQASEKNPLHVNLRGAQLVTAGAQYIGKIADVAEIPSSVDYGKIYLVQTDDPAYADFFPENLDEFSQFSLPIGTLQSLQAQPYVAGSSFDDKMEIYFDLNTITQVDESHSFRFQPKEGRYYTFVVHFMEYGEETGNACYGSLLIPMKVVPEHLVWKGGAKSNWNKDENWKRADDTDLKLTVDDAYVTNADNGTDNGFVPMLFSNVIMPEDSRTELYMAGYGDGGNSWVNTSRPADMEQPTENIQYDLMAYEQAGTLTTQRYRVNICNDIHFEKGAQMLHAEQLMYNRAWMDVELAPGQWTAVSTPLQGVVAGDWYVPSATGRQESPYFQNITFNSSLNDRLNPYIFQRSWSEGAKIVEQGNGLAGADFPPYAETIWSAAYNDACVPYVAGGGFSIRGIASGSSSPLLFRFPKEDADYDVSTGTPDRTNAGKLLITGLLDRSNPFNYVPVQNVKATLTTSADGKYVMVGNPYMAPMDVQAFLTENADVLQQKYWLTQTDEELTEATAVVYNAETGLWTEPTTLIPPYGAFYAEIKSPVVEISDESPQSVNKEVSVLFTANMQQFVEETGENAEGTSAVALQIRASDGKYGSSATLMRSDAARNDYQADEDAELIQNLDGNAQSMPMVYTVAGNRAVSANLMNNSRRIPLGVFAPENSKVTLTFQGISAVNEQVSLYDAQLDTTTPLYEGYSLTVEGASHGRYVLLTNETTDMEQTSHEDEVLVYSIAPGQVIVTAQKPLGAIRIWTTNGNLIRTVQTEGNSCIIRGMKPGVVLVDVNGESHKILVK